MMVRRFLLLAVLCGMGCKPVFNAGAYSSTDDLYAAGMREYAAKSYENAAHAFERLTTELSPRDPRIALAYFCLAKSQEKTGDNLLGAKSYSLIFESLPQYTPA